MEKKIFKMKLNEEVAPLLEKYLPMSEIKKTSEMTGLVVCTIGEVLYSPTELRLFYDFCPQIDDLISELKEKNLDYLLG